MTGYKMITQYAVARKAQRRIGYSHDRHASRYKPKWRCFWRMVDVANGLGQRHSRFENSESARRYGRDGGPVISSTGRGRGYGDVLCLGGKNWEVLNDLSGGGLGCRLAGTWLADLG